MNHSPAAGLIFCFLGQAEALRNGALTPPWASGELRTIAQTRRDLLASLTRLDAAFDVAKGWVQAWSARVKSKSDRSGSNPATDTGQELSTEEAIEFAQLMGALS